MSYNYELLSYNALSQYHVDLLRTWALSDIPRLAYQISSRYSQIVSLAGGMLVTIVYAPILVPDIETWM